MDFDYKKYSLDKLNEWMHDAISCSEATPQEIYDVIKGVVNENYHIYKNHTERCYEILCLLNGNGIGHIKAYDDYVTDPKGNQVRVCDKDDPTPECQGAWNDFWEENYYPEECNTKSTEEEKQICREYNVRESEYLDKRAKLDLTYNEMIAAGYTMTADGFWIKEKQQEQSKYYYEYDQNDLNRENPFKDKVKKWVLPVEECKDADTDEIEYFVSFPDDLLEAANLKEGDQVEWVDNSDGSYLLRKVTKPLEMNEC